MRQRPRDCKKEFQINLKWSVPSIEMLGLGKNINHQILQVRLRFQRSSNVMFWLQLCWKLSLNWSSGGRHYVFRNNRVDLQLIAMRTFMRVNCHCFFFIVFGFVCQKCLTRGIYLYKSLVCREGFYTDKFLLIVMNSIHQLRSSPLRYQALPGLSVC